MAISLLYFTQTVKNGNQLVVFCAGSGKWQSACWYPNTQNLAILWHHGQHTNLSAPRLTHNTLQFYGTTDCTQTFLQPSLHTKPCNSTAPRTAYKPFCTLTHKTLQFYGTTHSTQTLLHPSTQNLAILWLHGQLTNFPAPKHTKPCNSTAPQRAHKLFCTLANTPTFQRYCTIANTQTFQFHGTLPYTQLFHFYSTTEAQILLHSC